MHVEKVPGVIFLRKNNTRGHFFHSINHTRPGACRKMTRFDISIIHPVKKWPDLEKYPIHFKGYKERSWAFGDIYFSISMYVQTKVHKGNPVLYRNGSFEVLKDVETFQLPKEKLIICFKWKVMAKTCGGVVSTKFRQPFNMHSTGGNIWFFYENEITLILNLLITVTMWNFIHMYIHVWVSWVINWVSYFRKKFVDFSKW